jgi:putative peptidoglycan lipid II flippase
MNLLKALGTVSGFTLLSRITGLMRETITSSMFGVGAHTDAFFVAFRIPNLLRRLFAEGAFSQAFVPMLAREREAGQEQVKGLIDRVATVLLWCVVGVTLIGMGAAPIVVYLAAGGLAATPESFDAAVVMTRWMFPYITLISLVSLAAGILNSWRKFAIPAFTPVLLNLCFIAAAVLLSPYFDPPIYALAAGVLIGGVAQLALQIPALLALGLLPKPGLTLGAIRTSLSDPQVRQIILNMGPAALAVSVAQISLLLNTHIASRLGTGSNSWITYGDRLMEFPTALLGVALGTVLTPLLARSHAAGNAQQYGSLLDWGLRLCLILALPCMIGLAVFGEAITAMIFHYGKFSNVDVLMTNRAVLAYSVGLLGLIGVKILAPGFYAQQNLRTPVKIGLAVLAITQLLNLPLVYWFKHAGLALSISFAAWINAGLLLWGLHSRGSISWQAGWGKLIAQTVVASALMGLALWWFSLQFDWLALKSQPLLRIALVLGGVGIAACIYIVTLIAAGVKPRELFKKI